MDFIKDIRVREERAETGFGAKIDRLTPIFGARKISWVGIAKDPTAEGDKTFVFLRGMFGHYKN